jgi:hypothetical protein
MQYHAQPLDMQAYPVHEPLLFRNYKHYKGKIDCPRVVKQLLQAYVFVF